MSRRSLPALLVLTGVLALGVVWLVRTVGRAGASAVEAPTPAASALTPALQTATTDAPIESALVAPAREEAAPASKAFDPKDAIWLEGRVRLPDGTPADEHVEVLALGDSFDWNEAQRTPLAPDGSFRVGVAKTAKRASIDLASRYVYLPEPLRLGAELHEKNPAPILLSPKLGGGIHGRMILPPNALDRRASLVGTTIQTEVVSDSARGWTSEPNRRSARADTALEFELGGLPPDRHAPISARPKGMVDVDDPGALIQVGRIVRFDLELQVGGKVSGKVVDEKGAPVAAVEISALGELVLFTSGGDSEAKTDAAGAFDIAGIRPGKATLEAHKEGWTVTSLELGELADGAVKEGISLVLRRGLSISGRVQWPDGRPADACRLEFEYEVDPDGTGLRKRDEQRTRTTAADGSFDVSGFGSELVALTATVGMPKESDFGEDAADGEAKAAPKTSDKPTVPGHAHAEGVKPGTTGLVLTLELGKVVRGRALDDQGAPVAQFQVQAVPLDGSDPWKREQHAVRASADAADGQFDLPGLHDGAWDVSGEAKGHAKSAPHRVVIPQDTESFDLVLPRAASLSGTVHDPTGGPVDRATVRALPSETDRMWHPSMDEDEGVRTDAEGRFTIEDVAPGPQKLFASMEGFADSDLLSIDAAPGQAIAGLTLTLRRGGRIVGEVLDDAGRGQANRKLGIQGITAHQSTEVTADRSGHFEASALAPGKYFISTEPSDEEMEGLIKNGVAPDLAAWTRIQKSASADVVEGETTHVVLGGAQHEGIRIHGTITCAGRPEANWMLWAMRAESGVESGVGALPQSGSSDAQGRYELFVESAGAYVLSVNEQKRGVSFSDRIDVPAGTSFEHDIVIPSGRIAGRVLGPDGSPAPNIQVLLGPDEPMGELASAASYGEKETDPKGVFAFESVKAATYRLTVTEMWSDKIPKWGACTRTGLVLVDGGNIDGIEIRLAAAARIEGKLVGPDGKAVAGAMVTVLDEQRSSMDFGMPTISDGSGAFRIDGLGAGKVTLTARTRRLVTAGSPTVTVRAGETTHVEISLVAGTVLRVIVQDASGEPVWADVRVEDDRGRDVGERYMFDDESTFGGDSPDGGQKFGPVPAGRYKVTATNHDKQSVSQDVSVSGAEQVVTLKYGG